MSVSSDLQTITADLLSAPGAISEPSIGILQRKPKQRANDIEAQVQAQSFCVYIMRPIPISAMQGIPQLVFDKYEIRARVIETPAAHDLTVDAYDIADDVALALHWQEYNGILSHPLQIASRPYNSIEDPKRLIVDVVFHAILQIQNI